MVIDERLGMAFDEWSRPARAAVRAGSSTTTAILGCVVIVIHDARYHLQTIVVIRD
jgi:hypothetical protein